MSQLRRHQKRWHRDYPELLHSFTIQAAAHTGKRNKRRARELVFDALIAAWFVPWPALERSPDPIGLQLHAGWAAMARTVRRHKRERRLAVSLEELTPEERAELGIEDLDDQEAA